MKEISKAEEMIMLAIWRLKDNAYGVTIRQYVSEETGRTYPYGTLYSALDKLARKGFLTRSTGDPSPERGGRRKYYYHITSQGIEALRAAMELKRLLWDPDTEMALSKS